MVSNDIPDEWAHDLNMVMADEAAERAMKMPERSPLDRLADQAERFVTAYDERTEAYLKISDAIDRLVEIAEDRNG